MNIYYMIRNDEVGYDEVIALVVFAVNAEEAKSFTKVGDYQSLFNGVIYVVSEEHSWLEPVLLGKASTQWKESFVVSAEFNAG